jgi:O-antigen ligase
VIIWHLYRIALGHVSLLATGCAGLLLLGTFLRWERRGRSVSVVLAAFGVVVLDAALYPSTAATQLVSVFHPYVAGQSFRLTQIVIAVALVARLLARGMPRRVQAVTLLWLVFFVWYFTAAVTGLMQGNDSHLVTSRAMLVLEAGGMLVLASGVAPRDYFDDRGLPRLVVASGAMAAVLFVMSSAKVSVTTGWPHLPLLDFGEMGADAATLFPAIGLVGFAMELSTKRRRPLVLVASTVLVLAVFASTQRAARLGLAVALGVFLVTVIWPRRRRFTARTADLALVAACALAIAASSVFVHAVSGETRPSIAAALPFSSYTTQAVRSDYRQGSVQSRYNEWAVARPLIRARPVAGYGLAKTFVHYDVGTGTFIDYDITNNIALDLLVRTGAVGLVLFVSALAGTLAGAWRVWRRASSDTVSLVAAMTGAVLVGFIAKGMVESVLNEFHLTPLLGFLAGLVLALVAGDRTSDAGSAVASGSGASVEQ